MLTSDQFLHTAASNRSPRKPPASKLETQARQKSEVKRTFDAFTSKLKYRRRSIKEDELASSTSSLSLFTKGLQPKQELLQDNEGAYPPHYSSNYSIESEEPRTPEEQTFEGHHAFDTPGSVASSLPALSPDSMFQGVSSIQSSGQEEAPRINGFPRREPLLRYLSQDSFRLKGHNSSAPSSTHSHAEPESCGLCDMPLDSVFKLEQPVRMKCGHRAHKQCREDLILISEEFGDEMPTCTICSGSIAVISTALDETRDFDEGIETSSHLGSTDSRSLSFGSLFGGVDSTRRGSSTPATAPSSITGSRDVHDSHHRHQSLAQIMSPERQTVIKQPSRKSLSSSTSSTPSAFPGTDQLEMSPTSNATSRRRALSISSEASSVSKRSQRSSNGETSLMRSLVSKALSSCEAVDCNDVPSTYPLKLMTYVSPPKPDSSGLTTSRVGLWLHCPDSEDAVDRPSSFSLPDYRTSAKDITHGISLKKGLERLKYDSKPLSSAQLGILRLHSQVRVTSPEREQLDWPQVDCYLFEKQLVLVTNSNNRVRAVLDASQAIASAEADIYEPSILCLKFTMHKLPELHFHTDSPAIVALWRLALQNRHSQFPLHPRLYLSYIEDLEVALELSYEESPTVEEQRAPVKAVICVPSSVVASGSQVQQLLNDSLRALGKHDRVAVIAYQRGGVLRASQLEVPSWNGWNTFFVEEEIDRPGTVDSPSSARRPSLPSAVTPSASQTFDNVLEAARSLLSAAGVQDGSSVTIVSQDDTKLGTIPAMFKDSAIPIHTVGFGDKHDELTLSTMSRTTGGTYTHAKRASELRAALSGIMKREAKLVLSNVVIRFKARIGAEISDLQHTALNPDTEVASPDSGERVVEWKVGRMRKGEVRSLSFEVKGSILENKPLLQLTIEHESATDSDSDRRSSFLRLSAPAQDKEGHTESQGLQSMYQVEHALSLTFQRLQDALALIISEDHRRAFSLLSSGLDEVHLHLEEMKRSDTTLPEARALVEALAAYFDQQCDNIIEHRQPVSSLIQEYLQKLWLLDSRHALLVRDKLEAVFY